MPRSGTLDPQPMDGDQVADLVERARDTRINHCSRCTRPGHKAPRCLAVQAAELVADGSDLLEDCRTVRCSPADVRREIARSACA